jgi:hypothetical protein
VRPGGDDCLSSPLGVAWSELLRGAPANETRRNETKRTSMERSYIPLSLPCPVVCTLSTGEVEASSLRNGLAFSDLLSAFSAVQLQTQFRSISSNYPLRELRVRFVRASELQSRPVSLSERLLDAAVRPQAEADGDWYRRYRSLLKEVILFCPCPLSSTLFFCVL